MPPPYTIVSPANLLVTGSPRAPVSSVKRAANVFLLFILSPSLLYSIIQTILIFFFSFQQDAVTNVTSAVSYSSTAVVFCGGICITGFLNGCALFGQIKNLSRRFKVFTRTDFEVQFSDVMKRMGSYCLTLDS